MSEVLYTYPKGLQITDRTLVSDCSSNIYHLPYNVDITAEGILAGLFTRCGQYMGEIFVVKEPSEARKLFMQPCRHCFPEYNDY